MLRELHIQNLAVIEDATVELGQGLNAFTGQTGAGKSLILGAFEGLLGLKQVTDMLRPGADQGRISGLFELHDPATVAAVAGVLDQQIEPGEELLIVRKLFASGRSSVSVNGQPATAAMVREIGEALVDIHGQHDHQYLLRPSNQLDILDAFARCSADRDAFADRHARLRGLRERKAELAASRALRRQQLELYQFQAAEIDKADPQPGELPELEARHRVLSNLMKIRKDAAGVQAALYEAEGSIGERLQMMTHVLRDLVELDENLAAVSEGVSSAAFAVQEAAFELGRYINRLDDDPAELAEAEDRLNMLNRLVQKYGERLPAGDDAGEPVIRYREKIESEIRGLRGQDEDLEHIDEGITASEREMTIFGAKLTQARAAAAKKLMPEIERELKELGMGEAKFRVELDTLEPGDPDVGPTGLDRVEFVVRTNPGQAFRPLRQIASGGELSRVMLALKGILAGSDRISVLVFDEIDANIGGRLGSVIGRKLRALAGHKAAIADRASHQAATAGRATSKTTSATTGGGFMGTHQVLCITHLPQIAAFADRHFRILKTVTGSGNEQKTATTVAPLADEDRIEELADMMAGSEATKTTRKQAKELLDAAA